MCGGPLHAISFILLYVIIFGVRVMASREAADCRGYTMAGPLSFLQDIEDELGVTGLLVDGLDEVFELPHAEGDLRGSPG